MSDPAVILRPYQREAINAVIAARRSGIRRMVVCLPTGAGKTVIFSELARLAKKQVLVLAHREELLSQASNKLKAALPAEHIVSLERGSDRASANAKVLVCSIRSLHEKRLRTLLEGRDIGLIIYDECHHAAAEDNMRVLRQLGAFNESWTGTLVGFTATTARGDGKGLETVFDKIVYVRRLHDMIDDGYLVPLRGYRISTTADLSKLSAGSLDFRDDELAEAVDIEERNLLVSRSIQELARDRRTIVFCVTVNHALNLSRALNALGVASGVIFGEMPPTARAQALADFRNGSIQVLANVAVLTEGFDDPGTSCIAMARPTRSEGLYAQCVGRGTRLHPHKKDCLILDFVDVSSLSLCTLPSLFGMPRNVDLAGQDVSSASRLWQKILFDRPEFELEAKALTLPEIQDRAAAFNPLTLEVNSEVRAISHNAWFSLGRHGLGLHFESHPGKPSEVLVLRRMKRGKTWEVLIDQKTREWFSSLEEAVEAVDYELQRRGLHAARSALPSATWRTVGTGENSRVQELQQTALNRVRAGIIQRP